MAEIYLQDYHLHSAVTIDARMDVAGACERAISMGLREIAFTNHVMLAQPDYLMTAESLIDHWQQIQVCQSRFPGLQIKLGLEMDYYQGREGEIESAIEHYQQLINRPFDLVLGSIHEVRGVFFSNKRLAPTLFDGHELIPIFQDYFELCCLAVRSKLFDVLAHPDLIKKYTYELTPPLPFECYRPAVESLVRALLENGVGLEVNTKGLKLPVNEPYPSYDFIKCYLETARSFGVDPFVTLGSDAHQVSEVGRRVAETADNLCKLGVRAISTFDERICSTVEIFPGEAVSL